ncbi:MAG: hypothetical protein ACLFSQ_13130 [Candidatus Zixiibacteriota bacterium]
MRYLIFTFLISASLFAKVIVKPHASRFIDAKLANDMYYSICEKVDIPPDEIGDIKVYAPDDDKELWSHFENRTPEWGVAFAIPSKRTIIMKRAGHRPNRVLAHEITHIIIHQKAGTHLPRWFDEGMAEYASRSWSMRDEFKMAHFSLAGIPPLSKMESLYRTQRFEAQNMYALAYQAMLYLREEYGEGIFYDILNETQRYHDFDKGFEKATSIPVYIFDADFRKHIQDNYGYIRLLTNTQMLWYFILFLFLVGGSVKLIRRYIYKKKLDEIQEEKIEYIDFDDS